MEKLGFTHSFWPCRAPQGSARVPQHPVLSLSTVPVSRRGVLPVLRQGPALNHIRSPLPPQEERTPSSLSLKNFYA